MRSSRVMLLCKQISPQTDKILERKVNTRGILVQIRAVLHACEWHLTTVLPRATVEHTTVSPYITKEMK